MTTEDLVDLSGISEKYLWVPTTFKGDAPFSYTKTRVPYYGWAWKEPFPPGTIGFFYLHRTIGAPEESAEVRFHITRNPDPRSFSSGRDLLLHGVPWCQPLLRQRGLHFDNLLLREGLVSTSLPKMRKHAFRFQNIPIIFAFK